MDNSIHVALAIYDPSGTYSQHVGVVVTSLFEHTKSPVIVHLLHDETLTDLNRERFIKTAEKYNQTVDFVNVEDYKNKINKDLIAMVENKWTIGAFYRLFIPEILNNLEKIIYLDCDLVVNLDISELWDIDIGDNCLGGVLESGFSKYEKFREKIMRITFKEYINSGVLIMNLRKIRERGDLFLITVNWLKRHSHSALYPDQDAINSIFSGSIKFLNNKYNYRSHCANMKIDPCAELPDCIAHFPGLKPWNEFYGYKSEQLYWSTLFKSVWLGTCNGGGGGVWRRRAENRKFYGNSQPYTPASPKNTPQRKTVF